MDGMPTLVDAAALDIELVGQDAPQRARHLPRVLEKGGVIVREVECGVMSEGAAQLGREAMAATRPHSDGAWRDRVSQAVHKCPTRSSSYNTSRNTLVPSRSAISRSARRTWPSSAAHGQAVFFSAPSRLRTPDGKGTALLGAACVGAWGAPAWAVTLCVMLRLSCSRRVAAERSSPASRSRAATVRCAAAACFS